MKREKNDSYYLDKIISDLSFIIEHTKDKSIEEVMSTPLLLDSVMFRLIQVSENNDKLSIEFREKNNSIPWQSIKGMRNRIVHDYGFLNSEIVKNEGSLGCRIQHGHCKGFN